MKAFRNFRVIFLVVVLLAAGIAELLREHRPSFLRPGLKLYAYVTTAGGSLAVVDLVKLRAVGRIDLGPHPSGLRAHPTRAEIWSASADGGYLWVVSTRTNQVSARIAVGPRPYAVDFSKDGRRAYTSASGNDLLLAVDCETHAILGRAKTGAYPTLVKVTPDGKSLLVVNRGGSLGIHDAATLQERARVPVVAQPEDVAVLPDNSVAFVLSRTENRISVVDLRRGLLLANLQLAGKPSQMILKPDGGELYVISPEAHGLQAINTWTHEVGDYVLLGSAPMYGALLPDAAEMYVTDRAAGRVMPLDYINRRIGRPINVGSQPGVMRFDPSAPGAKSTMLLVANQNSGDLAIIRTRTDS